MIPFAQSHGRNRGIDSHVSLGKDVRTVLAAMKRMAAFTCLALVPVGMLYLDIQWLRNAVGEWSLVEGTQLFMLVGTLLSFAILAIRRKEDRAFAVLAACFFACMMIRELDAAWDLVA